MKKSTPSRAVAAAPRLTAQDKKWRAQDDLRTLRSAAEIQADAARVKAAQSEAQQQMQALARVVKK